MQPANENESSIKCSVCSTIHPSDKKFCSECGASLDPVMSKVAAYLETSVKPQVDAIITARYGELPIVETEVATRVAEKLIGWAKLFSYLLGTLLAVIAVLLGIIGFSKISDINDKMTDVQRKTEERIQTRQQAAEATITSQIDGAVIKSQQELKQNADAELKISEQISKDSKVRDATAALVKSDHQKATDTAVELSTIEAQAKQMGDQAAKIRELQDNYSVLEQDVTKLGRGAAVAKQLAAKGNALGIDVSRLNGTVDWNAVKSTGISFVYIKASEGGTADAKFQENWRAAKDAGLVRGAYLFFSCRASIKEQADLFLKMASRMPGDLPPMVDFEPSCEDRNGDAQQTAELLEDIQKRTGCSPVFYTLPITWSAVSALQGRAFSAYPLFITGYSSTPAVPAPWKTWTFLQFSQQGAAGLPNFDIDAFNGSLADMKDFARKSCKLSQNP